MKKRNMLVLCLAVILILSCNLPAAATPGVETPTATFTPALFINTDTPTVTAPSGPLAAPTSDALNCRSGPATSWPAVAVLNVGQTTPIVGRTQDGTWLYVNNPSSPGSFCWISAAFATVTGDISGVQVVIAPATPTGAVVRVTHVDISVNPKETHVAGCIGPVQPVSISAHITTNGPIKLKMHFKEEQTGNLGNETLNFKQADTRDLSDSFTPPLHEGSYKITLVIEGQDLSGLDAVTTYKITC